jgi:hypothetical protein
MFECVKTKAGPSHHDITTEGISEEEEQPAAADDQKEVPG